MSVPREGGASLRRARITLLALALLFAGCSCDDSGGAPKKQGGAGAGPGPGTPRTSSGHGAKAAGAIASRRAPGGKVRWRQDKAAWNAAPSALRLLYFRTPGEFGCGLLEKISFRDPGLLKFLNAHAAARFVTLAQADTLARRYGVREVPTLVLLDHEGGFVGAITGYRPQRRLLEELRRLFQQAGKRIARAAALEADWRKAERAKDNPSRIAALDAIAEWALERRLYARAAKALEALLAVPGVETVRSLATLWMRRGQALAESGLAEAAERSFVRALAADSLGIYREAIAFRRAEALTFAGRLEKAAALWASFAKRYPKSKRAETAAYNRIYCLYFSGKKKPAAQAIVPLLRRNLSEPVERALRTLLFSTAGAERALAELRVSRQRRTYLADALAEGRVLMRKYSCTDCHLSPERAVPSSRTSCVECHLLIRRLSKDSARHTELLRRNPHFFRHCARVRHLLRVPDLTAVGARVRPEWIERFLEAPYDLRPYLDESMPRIKMQPAERGAFVRYFRALAVASGFEPPSGREDREAPSGARSRKAAARGKRIFEQRHCYLCHQFGNVRFGPGQGSWNWDGGRAEAPNLRFTRDRLTRRTAAQWIRDPQRMDPRARMPKFPLDGDQMAALVEYLFSGDPGRPYVKKTTKPPRAPKRSAPPAWDEVNAAVFQDSCIHCHMSDEEGGAGNVGAYGYRARRLDLSSYAGLRRGSLQADGTRLDLLKPRPGGRPPMLLERILRRVKENERDRIPPFQDPLTPFAPPRHSPAAPGMPLGHPALTPRQIALVRAWIKAGATGPKPRPLDDPERHADYSEKP